MTPITQQLGQQELEMFGSVEHDPVPRLNRIRQFRTGPISDWISKENLPDQMWISKLCWSLKSNA